MLLFSLKVKLVHLYELSLHYRTTISVLIGQKINRAAEGGNRLTCKEENSYYKREKISGESREIRICTNPTMKITKSHSRSRWYLANASISQVGIKFTASVTSSVAAGRYELLSNTMQLEAQLLAARECQAIEVEERRLKQRKEELDVKTTL